METILVLNGPNLQHLGMRETAIYGKTSLHDIENRTHLKAKSLGLNVVFHQCDEEYSLLKHINDFHKQGYSALIFNPAALTHSSIVLRDALLAHKIHFLEVHLSNPQSREPFRRTSLFTDIARGSITGCGAIGYELALEALNNDLGQSHG